MRSDLAFWAALLVSIVSAPAGSERLDANQRPVVEAPAESSHRHDHTTSLGTVHFPVSCTPEAQAEFDRAAALLHHMTYPQAREAFERVAALDPTCAMARWGVAMTLFQPTWPTRPGPAELERGWNAVREALSLDPPSERERLFLAAAEAFFGLELESWLAHAGGEFVESIDLMRRASEIEVSTPKHAVTPGPTLPAQELLGDLLLAQDRPAEALTAYRRSLELYPRRFNSLLGAARSARRIGDGSSAAAYYRELEQSAATESRRSELEEARLYPPPQQ